MGNETKQPDDTKTIMEKNAEFLDAVLAQQDGPLTKISSASTSMLRSQIREEGFMRKIIPPMPITNEQLDRVLEHDRPVRIEDMEPNSKGAVTLPFNVSTDASFFYGRRFATEFFTIKTKKYVKSIHELRTYTMDLREVITENSLKDIQTEEDGNLIGLIDEIVGSTPGAASPYTGVVQYDQIAGGITRNTYVEAKKYLEKQRLNNGVFLMNRSTAKEFEKWTRDEIGGDLSESIFRDGLKALGEAVITGVPHIFTIKDELVPDNVVYMFTEPNFLGRFYILQDVTMYVEKKEDQIMFSAGECIGYSIPNMLGVAKIEFTS